ncbi:hypothetical protein BC833DRAFT_612583 [Globomyces pollinis-pini]|nr:hypothetical protein BC833DRAFT_612583 [Globomyces pollinis-pini]
MESDLDWCLSGCGKKSQLGSIYCSPSCFRLAITCNLEEASCQNVPPYLNSKMDPDQLNLVNSFSSIRFISRMDHHKKRWQL